MHSKINQFCLFLLALSLFACESETILKNFNHNFQNKLVFLDSDTSKLNYLSFESKIDIVKIDSVLRAENATRNHLSGFFVDKIKIEFDKEDSSGLFANYSKIEVFIAADSLNKKYQKILVGQLDSMHLDSSRSAKFLVIPSQELKSYFRADNIYLITHLYPKSKEIQKAILTTKVYYSGLVLNSK